ncbi:MAG: hypothetical protein AB7U83_07715, partial [Vicinamibacterales bacterium]
MRARTWLAVTCAMLLAGVPAAAQYAEVPRPLPAPVAAFFGFTSGGWYTSAVQIGRRLFVAGVFSRLGPATGGAVVVDLAGQALPDRFPHFAGTVTQIILDGAGGWLVAGDFTSVAGQPIAGFARVAANRAVDPRFRVVANGAIRRLALAHGRVYLAGEFTAMNGAVRRGLAALDGATGQLTPWGAGFDSEGGARELSVSSQGVYVLGGSTGLGHLWGLDAADGRVLFDRPGTFATALAASSARVYLGGAGSRRPVWAVDPFTGADTDWQPGLSFQYIPVTYGWDGTQVMALLIGDGRLYIGGRFQTTDGRRSLAAVDAADGTPSAWRPAAPGPSGSLATTLTRIGPALVANLAGTLLVVDVVTAALLPFTPQVSGSVQVMAAAPEGVVLGGSIAGTGGVDRAGLASIDLDTYQVEPWTSALTVGLDPRIEELATDGTWLFARLEGTSGGSPARVIKIDPVSGAIVSERQFASTLTRMRVAGGDIVVSTLAPNTSVPALGVITIADWSYAALPVTLDWWVTALEVTADTIYLGGPFTTVNGESRPALASVDRATGSVQPWRPNPDARVTVIRAAGGRIWVAGDFGRIGGQRRRSLAELDPASGAATAWNPDVSGLLTGGSVIRGIHALEISADGLLYAAAGAFPLSVLDATLPAVAAGQLTASTLVWSTATGRRLPWRPTAPGMLAAAPDCLLTVSGCLPPAVPAPTDLAVAQSGATVTLTWQLPPSPTRTGVRLEVGTVEGLADLLAIDLPPSQQSFSAVAPPGRYAVRVRALAGVATSLTSADVTFAVGPPAVPGAPLDVTGITDGPSVAFTWQPPSAGVPSHYELEGGTSPGRRDFGPLVLSGAATSASLVAPVGTFWTRLVAVNAAGRSAPSAEVFLNTVPPQSCSTSPPCNLGATVAGRIVPLTW